MRLLDCLLLAAAVTGTILLASCSTSPKALSAPLGPHLNVTSSAFKIGERIPDRYTGLGEDISPQLAWTNVPPGTKSFALIVDDPDAPGEQPWVHWVAWNIPATSTELADGAAQAHQGLHEGKNDFGNSTYNGPMPPPGKVHHYLFKVYALKTELTLPSGSTKADLVKAMKDQIILMGVVIGTYEGK